MDRQDLQEWLGRYEQCWRTAGTDLLADLFASDVTYVPSPWRAPVEGLAALADFWEDERDGPDNRFSLV
jgi:hypothetical protein